MALRVLVLLLLVLALAYVGYLAIALGPQALNLSLRAVIEGEHRTLWPAELRGAPLRSGERVYVLTTQQERIVPLYHRRVGAGRIRNLLHVDLWAFEAATATPAWRRRVRTYEDDRGTLMFELLGLDGGTLWLFVREPLAIAASDGSLVADGAALEARNPPLAGKRVDEPGYVAFGGQGLQLTLTDATQWVVDGGTLAAVPRAAAASGRPGVLGPAPTGTTRTFQLRGLPLGARWVGVLTDVEAERLKADPVVPGAKPDERRGAAYDFYASQHVPGLLEPQPQAYRVWGARVAQVSAAPRDWPKELPDNWGTRDAFSDYQVLPEAPPFLQAGLLGDGRSDRPFSARSPDSVLVLHHDKVGGAGRLRVARVSGPSGRVVWDVPLGLADLEASLWGEQTLAFVGEEPNPAYDPRDELARATHEKIVGLDVASGAVAVYDLSAESVRPDGNPPAAAIDAASTPPPSAAAATVRRRAASWRPPGRATRHPTSRSRRRSW